MGVVLPCACDRIAGFPTDGQGAGSHRLTMPSPRVAVVVSYTETCSRPGGHTQTAYFLLEPHGVEGEDGDGNHKGSVGEMASAFPGRGSRGFGRYPSLAGCRALESPARHLRRVIFTCSC